MAQVLLEAGVFVTVMDDSPWEIIQGSNGGGVILKQKGAKKFLVVQTNNLFWADYGKSAQEIFEENAREFPEYSFKKYYLKMFSENWAFFRKAQQKWYRWLFKRKHQWVRVTMDGDYWPPFWTTQKLLDHHNELRDHQDEFGDTNV